MLERLEGKQVMVGCIDLSDMAIESPETIAARVRRALPYVTKERVILAPDCGMKYLPRAVAQGKLKAMWRRRRSCAPSSAERHFSEASTRSTITPAWPSELAGSQKLSSCRRVTCLLISGWAASRSTSWRLSRMASRHRS